MAFWKKQNNPKDSLDATPLHGSVSEAYETIPEQVDDSNWSQLLSDDPELAGQFVSSALDRAEAERNAAFGEMLETDTGNDEALSRVREAILTGKLPSIIESSSLRNGLNMIFYLPGQKVTEANPMANAIKYFYEKSLRVVFDPKKGLEVSLREPHKAAALVRSNVIPAVFLSNGALSNEFMEWDDFSRELGIEETND